MNPLKGQLAFLDWVTLGFTLMLTAAAVIYSDYVGKKTVKNDLEKFLDILVMGRQLTLPLFVASLVASWYGGIFGVTKIAFEKGVYNFVTQGFFWYLAYITFAFFIVDKIAHYKAITLPDLVGKMFGPKAKRLSAVYNLFNTIPIAYTISLGLFLQSIFGGSLVMQMIIGVVLVTSYSMFGGMRADVFSDCVQFFIMCSSVLVVVIYSVTTYGGLAFLKSSLPASHFDPTGGQHLLEVFAWGFIAFATLVDPNFYQRCFAATSTKVAKKGILISVFIWFCFDICTTLGGMYARAVMPEANSDNAYLIYSMNLLPDGMRGFILGGILATILSTMDSYLIIAASTVSFDMANKYVKNKIWAHHAGMIIVGVLSVIIGYYFEGNIKNVWKTLGSYAAACLLFPMLWGYIFPKKISDNQFVFGSFSGMIATTYWRNVEHTGFWVNVDELYAGVFFSALGMALWSPTARLLRLKRSAPRG
jgi:SSS family solute:Na+ symporter